MMRTAQVSLPTIGMIAGTRVALGAGLGLLFADRLTPEKRCAAGWALVAVGAVTTIPLLVEVFGSRRETRNCESQERESLEAVSALS
ncbi:MAG: hypothetical protein JWM11_2375 [Planctomycetaceae bacterium]|nr:hypothetical protein [Planctomycetaceae bacterium]